MGKATRTGKAKTMSATMAYSAPQPKGQVRFCHITQRTGSTEPMFYQRTDGTIVANLVGYRIEPLSDEERRALGDTTAGEGE